MNGTLWEHLADIDKQAEYIDSIIQSKVAVKPQCFIDGKYNKCYIICDIVIGMILKKYFHIQNRITWQREKGRGVLSNWKNGMEDIWFATMSKEYTFNVEH